MSLLQRVGEQFSDVSRTLYYHLGNTMRSFWNGSFFKKPSLFKTTVNSDLTRSLYRNDNPQFNLGAGFVRSIIDLSVEYIGLPYVTSNDDQRDSWLNECIHDHWGPQLQEVMRDAMRDAKTIVRFRQPRLDNPLFTEEDRMHGRLESWPPELVDITYDPSDPDLVERAVFTHYIEFDERTDEEVLRGEQPRVVEHEVQEVITPAEYRWFDRTGTPRELTTWRTPNRLGFVPAWTIYNEYSADLGGGQSDIEPVLPFIQAFHEVMLDALAAHKYHSTPKLKFKLKDVITFLRNNFPEVLDEGGKVKAGAKINWTGREILLFSDQEDGDFIEAKSVLGDSKTLLEFLVDCIAIAAETPKWALLKDQGATDKDATVHPFEKKIERKRVMFGGGLIVMVCKMAQAAVGQTPTTVRVTWRAIRTADLAAKAQAIQQIVMAMDVAASHEWVADNTVIAILASLFPEVSAPEIEKARAANNVVPLVPAPSPQSPTAGALPPASKSTNGAVAKPAAKAAIATTSASKS